MAISHSFSCNLFVLALVILSHMIMVAHGGSNMQSGLLNECYGNFANDSCCNAIANMIKSGLCSRLCMLLSQRGMPELVRQCQYQKCGEDLEKKMIAGEINQSDIETGTKETVQSSRIKEMSSQCNVDSSKFSEPVPWVGLYIAAASFLCFLLMGIDTSLGFYSRKLWFPSHFFSLNATSLTLLSVAVKLPVDLTTSMPGPQDQLTKLSGTILICTVMGNFMTSLGTMHGPEMMSNVVALGILVVTVIVNIGIQMGTGVIYAFLPEHAVIIFFMLVLLVMLCSTTIMVSTAKQLLEDQYNKILLTSDDEVLYNDKLRNYVKKHWIMAHTGSPQYVVGRSATCVASGAFCLLGALILLQAAVRSFIIRSLAFCEGKSDYTWSTTLILISQATAIGVGTIAPAIRLFNCINFRSSKGKFKVEKYWIEKLVKWKGNTLAFHIGNRGLRRIFHVSKDRVLNVFIGMQCAVVLGSKLIILTSILPVIWLSRLCCCGNRLREGEASELQSRSNEGLKRRVLRLHGEEDLVPLIVTNGREDIQHWIRRGEKNPPKDLMRLLNEFTISRRFRGVVEFDSEKVPLLGTEKSPPNCWALTIVTLTSIAISIAPPCSKDEVKLLKRGVHESLKYVRLIEKNLDNRRLINMRKAADIVWLGIDTDGRWLGKDLKKLPLGKSDDRIREDEESLDCDTWRILEELAECGKEDVLAHITGSEKEEDPLNWPAKVLAANSMYRLCRTLLLKKLGTADQMFEWLQKTIADMVGACLTNLPRVISMTCVCSFIETREKSVRDAAYLVGETEEILTKLEISYPDDYKQYIESWIPNNTAEP